MDTETKERIIARAKRYGLYGLDIESNLDAAMIAMADAVALQHGWVSEFEDEEDAYSFPDDPDVLRALHEPFPLAAVFAALCRVVCVEPNDLIRQAAAELPALPSLVTDRT